MRIRHLLPLALASVAMLPGAASAQSTGPSLADLLKDSSPEELATAFKAICLDHAGDWAAQAAAGQAVPWKMQVQGNATSERAVYVAWPLQLGLNSKSNFNSCAITSSVDKGADLAGFAAKASTVLGLGKTELAGDKAFWGIDTPPGRSPVVLQIAPGAVGKIATFLLVTKKAD